MQVLYPGQIGIWNVFCSGKKTGEPGENLSQKGENQPQTQPTFCTLGRNRTQDTLVGGECSYHCIIPATPVYLTLKSHYILIIIWSLIDHTNTIQHYLPFALCWMVWCKTGTEEQRSLPGGPARKWDTHHHETATEILMLEMTCLHTFFCALRRPHVFALSFNWFTGLSM